MNMDEPMKCRGCGAEIQITLPKTRALAVGIPTIVCGLLGGPFAAGAGGVLGCSFILCAWCPSCGNISSSTLPGPMKKKLLRARLMTLAAAIAVAGVWWFYFRSLGILQFN